MTARNHNFLLFGLVLVSGILLFLGIRPGHNWGGDFALYISQAESILNNNPQELFEVNKFSIENSSLPIGPYLYPFGFPFLLAPAFWTFGLNLQALKIFTSLFALASIPFLNGIFQVHFKIKILPFLLIAGIMTHATFVNFADNILSDFPFFFFCFLSFWIMQFARSKMEHIALGVSIFFSYFIRDIGIFLLPSLFVLQILQFCFQKNPIQDWRNKLIPYGVFALLFMSIFLVLPQGGSNHMDLLFSKVTFGVILQNFKFYENLVTTFLLTWDTPAFFAIIPISSLICLGIYSRFQTTFHFFIFMILVGIMNVVWPAIQGERFWFPIFPFLLFFIFCGLEFLFDKGKIQKNFLVGFLSIWIGIISVKGFIAAFEQHRLITNQAATAEMRSLYKFIQTNTLESKIIGFSKPRVLRLFTNRNSIYIEIDQFHESVADFLLIRKTDGLKNMGQTYFETENYILISK